MTTRYATPDEIRIAMQHWHEAKRREARRLGLTPGKPSAPSSPTTHPGVGDRLHALIAALPGAPKKPCGSCSDMIVKMNRWGPDGCREHREEIIDHLMGQRSKLAAWVRLAMMAIPQPAVRAHLCGLLDEAITETVKPPDATGAIP